MVGSEYSSFKRVFCRVSGVGSKRHKRSLKKLGERLSSVAFECVHTYVREHPELDLAGSVMVFIDDIPESESVDEAISSCDVMIRKNNPFIVDSESFSKQYLKSATGEELFFFMPIGLSLERVYVRMILWNLRENEHESNRTFACELETMIIRSCLAAMPRGNSYLDEMAQKAKRQMVEEALVRYKFDNYDDFALCMRLYGVDQEGDEPMLVDAWKDYEDQKEGEEDDIDIP